MWENGNNNNGLPTMKVTTQNHVKDLLKPQTVDMAKNLAGKQEVHTSLEGRAMCPEVA